LQLRTDPKLQTKRVGGRGNTRTQKKWSFRTHLRAGKCGTVQDLGGGKGDRSKHDGPPGGEEKGKKVDESGEKHKSPRGGIMEHRGGGPIPKRNEGPPALGARKTAVGVWGHTQGKRESGAGEKGNKLNHRTQSYRPMVGEGRVVHK